ncbi:MAG: hypothetical protein GF320_08855 [Armatimonadia bacterium]|nr:hypothetical protein [Armatimonadia bacterium]
MTKDTQGRSVTGESEFWQTAVEQVAKVTEYFVMDYAVLRPIDHEFAPRTGRLVLDSQGVHFEPDYAAASDAIDLDYAEILSAVTMKDARDTVMVTTSEHERYLFCVLKSDLATGIQGIIRIRVRHHQNLRAAESGT